MSPVSRFATTMLAALLIAAVLPASVLAVDPVAVDDEFTIPVNSGVTNWAVMDNDTGTNLGLLDTLTSPAHGTAFVNGTHVHYTPDSDFHGTDSFDYTIDDGVATDVGTVTVIVNTPPVAVDDPGIACGPSFGGGFPVPEDYRFAGPPADTFVLFGACGLLQNDTDVDGDTLTYELLTQPAHGVAAKVDEDFFTYKADADYGTPPGSPPGQPWQLDTFTYRAFDGLSYSDPATMSFWVAAINDPPTFTPGPATVTVAEDSGQYSAAWATDISPGPFGESTQTVQFLPDGPNPVDQGTLDLFSEVPAIDGDGNLTFTVRPDAHGLATVTFVAKDDGGLNDYGLAPGTMVPPDDTSDAFSFQIAVTADDVTALDDNAGVDEDAGPTPLDVLANDTFASGATVTAVTQGAKGVVAIASDGLSVTYDPSTNASGSDTFTYTLDDGAGSQDTATVSVEIGGVNDPPNALNDAVSVPESAGATTLNVLVNDVDPDDPLHIQSVTAAAHGSVTILGGGTGLAYDPVQLYFGSDTFKYTLADGHGGTDTATVVVTVVKDTVKPTVTAPVESYYSQTVKSSTTKAHIAWSGSDAGTGIARYQLQVSVNGGAFNTVTLPSPTATSINRTQADNARYRYRVRATDRQGNVSAYVTGPTFTPVKFQNTSSAIVYTGSWTTVSKAKALGGSHRWASSLAARARLTRSVRDFAFVATKTPGSGSVQVWIDGTLAATINLRSSTTSYRKLVFARHFSTLGTHTIEIRPIGGGRVYLDAFLVMR